MFCVECGKEIEEDFDGMCIECYIKSRKFFEIPGTIEITVCRNCGSHKLESKWIEGSMEDALKNFLEGSIKHRGVKKFRVKMEGSRIICTGEFHEHPVYEEREVEIKTRYSICEKCSRMKGGYFEAILQVRKDGTNMTDEEIKLSDEVVYKKAGHGGYVTKREKKHGGIDYYMGDKKMAASAARILSDMFHGETSISPSLVGMKDGREMYRNTYVVRIPEYAKGGYVEVGGRVFRVFDMGKRIGMRDIETGEKKYFSRNEMSKVKVIGAEEMEAIVLSSREKEVQILDPENYKTVVISKPEDMEVGEKVRILKWKDRIYLTGG
ncbi:MAG: hypothetical protein FE043_00735 [Thermoplasmata archaeon]|nr:MAG: hypothetical protein FE043_00735 [Thermoplasmata archaeon]